MTTEREIDTVTAVDLLLRTAAANRSGMVGSTTGNPWDVRMACRRVLEAERLVLQPSLQPGAELSMLHITTAHGAVTWYLRPDAEPALHGVDPWTVTR
jgi:hypothetical protein